MYITQIKIDDYLSFDDFIMTFHDRLHVIAGSNNMGKSGLLRAMAFISDPDNIEAEYFSNNDQQKHFEDQYKAISNEDDEDDEDESIIKLLSFIGINKATEEVTPAKSDSVYTLVACVRMKYSLNSKKIGRYVDAVSIVATFEEFYNVLRLFRKYYAWNFTNGISETIVVPIDVPDIFQIDFMTYKTVLSAAHIREEHTDDELDKLVGVYIRKINSKLREAAERPVSESKELLVRAPGPEDLRVILYRAGGAEVWF